MTPKKRSPVTTFRYKELNTVLKSSPISSVDWIGVERFSNAKIDFIDMLSRCNVHLSIYDLRKSWCFQELKKQSTETLNSIPSGWMSLLLELQIAFSSKISTVC